MYSHCLPISLHFIPLQCPLLRCMTVPSRPVSIEYGLDWIGFLLFYYVSQLVWFQFYIHSNRSIYVPFHLKYPFWIINLTLLSSSFHSIPFVLLSSLRFSIYLSYSGYESSFINVIAIFPYITWCRFYPTQLMSIKIVRLIDLCLVRWHWIIIISFPFPCLLVDHYLYFSADCVYLPFSLLFLYRSLTYRFAFFFDSIPL